MITTLTQVKTLLQLTTTDATRDLLITALIPLLQQKVIRYCNNSFTLASDYLTAETIALISGAPAAISDTGLGFLDADLAGSADVLIAGSMRNDGIVAVATVTADIITLATGEALVSEDAGNLVTVMRVSFPPDLALPFSTLVKYYMEKSGKLVDSESLPGNYSVKYKTEAELMQIFSQYRKPYR